MINLQKINNESKVQENEELSFVNNINYQNPDQMYFEQINFRN